MAAGAHWLQLRMPLLRLLSALALAACGIGPCVGIHASIRGRSLAGGRANGKQILLGRVAAFEEKLVEEPTVGSGALAISGVEDSRLDVPVTIMDFLPKSNPSTCNGRRLFIYPNLPVVYNQLPLNECSARSTCRTRITRDGLGGLLPTRPTNRSRSESGSDSDNDTLQAPLFERKAWLQTYQNGLGVLFHARASLYDCLVSDWRDADAVYVPTHLDVLQWLTDVPTTDDTALSLARFLQSQPAFQRHGGSDHFIVVGNTLWDFSRAGPLVEGAWGSNVTLLPELQHVMFVSVEAMSWRPNTISVPYPTCFHPSTEDELARWQEHVTESPRPYLVALSCGARPTGPAKAIRNELISQCISRPDQCLYLNCSSDCPLGKCMGSSKGCSDPRTVANTFLSARFCLQPRGDSAARRSTFDAIAAGCIPVTFIPETLQHQYHYNLPGNKSGYSVLFEQDEVEAGRVNVVDELAKISDEAVAGMQKKLIDLMPNTIYRDHRRTQPASDPFKDAFDVALAGIFRHLKDLGQANG